MKPRFVNPFTDFGFKKLFGEEASKPHLIDFLNALLPQHNQIQDLTFRNAEQLGSGLVDRKAVFDIYCKSSNGESFIVEMQKAKQNYFKDRTLFYATFPIQEQAERGSWNYQLQPVYCVGVLDFTFDDYENEPERSQVVHEIKLKNQSNAVFYDKLTFIYLEMPNFRKTEAELTTRLDKWLYFIQNLVDLSDIPRIFGGEQLFLNAFEKAELVNLNPAEKAGYDASLKVYRDLKGVIDTARDEGEQIGLEKGEQIGLEKGEQIGLEKGEQIGLEKGEQIGLEKGEQIGLEKSLKRLLASGMNETEARQLLGMSRAT